MLINRIIGKHKGTKPGPMVVVLGAVHGNEPAGVRAIQEVFKMIEKEPLHNPGFVFHGTLLGLVGNMSGLMTGERYICEDLNRMWSMERIRAVQAKAHSERHAEERELLCFFHKLCVEIKEEKPDEVILLDLHTTSAKGGVFTIPDGSPESEKIALGLHVPVIKGLFSGIGQTSLHFVRDGFLNGISDGFPRKSIGIAFESGQHEEPKAVSRSISAVINLLRAVGCVGAHDVDSKHDVLLRKYSENLPKLLELEHVHHIQPEEGFEMQPGFVNFQKIKKGEHLANTKSGPIIAQWDARILMPLYQKRGTDGFFIVKEVG